MEPILYELRPYVFLLGGILSMLLIASDFGQSCGGLLSMVSSYVLFLRWSFRREHPNYPCN